MKKIEFMVDGDVEEMLDEVYKKNSKKYISVKTINDMAKEVLYGALLMYDTDMMEEAISKFAKRFAADAIKAASTNPELIKVMKEMFSKSAESDAKKWLEDKNKEKEKK